MADKKSATLRSRTDALVMVAATIGIAVLVNALATQTSVRADLTEQKVHTLSDASVQAARALDGVTVTVYISKKLPETLPSQQGKVPLKGIDRAFRDKLSEYATASGGKLRLVYADDNSPGTGTIEDQGEAARLEPFSSTEAQVSGGQLKFQRYVLGATFHYKTVSEVYAKALQPGFYEFEMTKILLRLKEKYDNSQLMKEPLAHGKAVFEGVKACNETVQKLAKVDAGKDDGGGLSLKTTNDPGQKRIEALLANRAELEKACKPVEKLVREDGGALKGKNQFGDTLVDNSDEFVKAYGELLTTLDQKTAADKQPRMPPAVAVGQLVGVLDQLFREVDRSHTNLADSPGRKQIGFLCGHDEFCPFAESQPLVQQEMAMMMAQNNPMMKQIVQLATQIAQAIDETNARIGDNLFTKRGYSIRKVEADTAIPDDVSALLIYAPRKALSEYQRFQLDQFLLSGRPVVVFAQAWEVALMNMKPSDELGNDMRTDWNELKPTGSNLAEVLKPYGVELGNEPVLDSTHVETVRVMQLVNRGGLQFQSQQDFPYALIPVATDFDRTHPLSRALQNMPMPFATTVTPNATLRADKRFEVAEVIRSSKTSLKKALPLPVVPPTLKELVLKTPANGPHTLALYVRGPFQSAFAGKEVPHRPDRAEKPDPMHPDKAGAGKQTEADYALEQRRFKKEGTGKLLVVASDLGIEGLSRGTVLAGFDVAKLGQFSAEMIKQYQEWQANYQNWQIRIGQIQHLLGDELQFLANVLDWSTSHEALVAIRSKGDTRRPLDQIEPEQARLLRLECLLGAPFLLVGAGLLRWRMRKSRNANLTV
jgi:ABC-type uncharacterized transport system involved in gliding motility auxiliary subunit